MHQRQGRVNSRGCKTPRHSAVKRRRQPGAITLPTRRSRMSKTRTEYFYGSTFSASRGECLRALIAAIYRTAKANRLFTTDEVFAQVGTEYNEHDFRVTTGPSKPVAV